MKHPRLTYLLLLTTLALGGCKIEITVPEGGSVTTASGNINCASGETCIIDVSDLFFDESFQAVPAEGYTFKGWKKQWRGFCGGSTGPCHLVTSGLEGDETLMSVLNDPTQVFYMEPEFEASSFGAGSARACFNTELVSADTRTESSYRSTDGASGEILNFEYKQTISGGHNFKGNAALRSRSEVVATGAAPSTSRTDSYYSVDAANATLEEYGLETDVSSPNSVQLEASFSPNITTRFDMEPGDSYSHSWTQTEDTVASGISFSNTREVTRVRSYLGRETITVPAGTFATCVFRREESDADGNSSAVSYFGVGSGMLIKEDAEGDVTVLLSATINGTPL